MPGRIDSKPSLEINGSFCYNNLIPSIQMEARPVYDKIIEAEGN